MGLRDRLAPFSGFPRAVYVVSAGQLLNTFGVGVVYPFATLYFYRVVGIPFGLVGVGLFANSVGTAVGVAVGGYLADRRGRRVVMVASMALAAPTLAAYALVGSAAEFVVAASAAGVALGLFTPASHAMVADLTAGDDRERAYGLLKVGNNVGFGAGFVAGGLLYDVARTSVFVVDGASSAVVAVLLWVALPRTLGSGPRADAPESLRDSLADWGRIVSRRRVLFVAGLNVLFAVAYAQMGSTVPVFAAGQLGLSGSEIGTLWTLNPITVVLFQLPVVAWAGRVRRTRGLVLSAGFWAASFLAVFAASRTPALVGVGLVGAFLVLRTVGELLHAPLVTALVSDMSDVDTRGTQLSVLEVAKRLGFGIGPVVGGLFFDYGAAELLWPTLFGMCLVLAGGLLVLERLVSPAENGVERESVPGPAD
jgi:MFS family permease